MNDDVKSKADDLVKTILDSEEYRSFIGYKELLNDNPLLKDRVQTFRKARIEAEFSGKSGKEITYLLTTQYADIMNNTVAAGYLNTELELCKLMQNINGILMEAIDLELDFF